MKILLSGFEPFGGSNINPSEQIVHVYNNQSIRDAKVTGVILPVDWLRAPGILQEAIDSCEPDAVICLGEAASRTAISIERVAVNLLDFRIPDNAGATIQDQPVVQDGPAAYFSTLPVRDILAAIQQCGVPAELSLSAGTYLCNQVMYSLLHMLSTRNINIPAGFIHLPSLPEQAAASNQRQPSMSLDTQLTGIREALETVISQISSVTG